MNALSPMIEAAWAERIGWTLVHSVWQVALVAAIYAVTAFALRRGSANLRYALGCVALVTMVAAPAATWVRVPMREQAEVLPAVVQISVEVDRAPAVADVMPNEWFALPSIGAAPRPTDLPLKQENIQLGERVVDRLSSWRGRLEPALPWLATCWLIGVLLLALRPLWGLWVVQRLRTRGISPLSTELRELAGRVMERLRVAKGVQFAESALVEVPTVVGYLRPMVLLPASAVTGLSTQQIELILAHELAHVRRHDYLVNLAQTAIEALLFYHPGMWWVSVQVRRERENCCDDVAVSVCTNRGEYIRALYALESQRQSTVPALAASGGSLVRRVRRLMPGARSSTRLDRTKPWLAGLIVLTMVVVIVTFGQSHAEESPSASSDTLETEAATAEEQENTVDALGLTTLTGRILYDGTPPQPEPIRFPPRGEQRDDVGRRNIWSDAEHYRRLGLVDESLIIGKDGGIANVVVWVRSKDMPAPPWSGPLPPSTIRVVDGRFDPHVLVFWDAAPLRFVNESRHGSNFNWQGMFNSHNRILPPGETVEIKPRKPERLPGHLTSNIHPWFKGYILPLAHPYFAVTGRDGRFEINNLPLGEWEFAIWHERAGWLATDRFAIGRFTWTIRPGENSLGDLRVDPKALGGESASPTSPAQPAEQEVPAIDKLDEQGFSQLHRAASGGHVERARKLLEAGANVDVQQGTYRGRPLQYAASFGHVAVVQVLIEHDATIDSQDANRRTPLIWAAMNGHADVIRRLLDAGADIQATNAGGWTPLHYAVDKGHVEAAQLLIDRGADIHAKNSQGKTPVDLNPALDLRIPWRALQRPSTSNGAESRNGEVRNTVPPATSQREPTAEDAQKPAREPTDVIAEVRGKPVLWRDIAPTAEWYERQTEYQRKHGHRRAHQSPDRHAALRLNGLIWKPLLAEYRKEHDVEPTEQEIEQFMIHARRSRERRKQEAAQEVEQLQQEIEQDRRRLDSPDLTPSDRQSLEQQIARRERQMDSTKRVPDLFKEQTAEEERFFAKWRIGNWKLQQSLYKKYSGRAIWQQVGPEALDAMHELLKEKEDQSFFEIHDPELRERFWEYYVNDQMHVFISDPDKIFEHPWSSLEEPNSGDDIQDDPQGD